MGCTASTRSCTHERSQQARSMQTKKVTNAPDGKPTDHVSDRFGHEEEPNVT